MKLSNTRNVKRELAPFFASRPVRHTLTSERAVLAKWVVRADLERRSSDDYLRAVPDPIGTAANDISRSNPKALLPLALGAPATEEERGRDERGSDASKSNGSYPKSSLPKVEIIRAAPTRPPGQTEQHRRRGSVITHLGPALIRWRRGGARCAGSATIALIKAFIAEGTQRVGLTVLVVSAACWPIRLGSAPACASRHSCRTG